MQGPNCVGAFSHDERDLLQTFDARFAEKPSFRRHEFIERATKPLAPASTVINSTVQIFEPQCFLSEACSGLSCVLVPVRFLLQLDKLARLHYVTCLSRVDHDVRTFARDIDELREHHLIMCVVNKEDPVSRLRE